MQPASRQADVASPCNKICTLNAADICIGCGRTRGEITDWFEAGQTRRQQIVDLAARRLMALDASVGSTPR